MKQNQTISVDKGSMISSSAGVWLKSIFPLVVRNSILSNLSAFDLQIIPLTKFKSDWSEAPGLISWVRYHQLQIKSYRGFAPKQSHACYLPAPAMTLNLHSHSLSKHSLLVLSPPTLHGYDLKQESHLPEFVHKIVKAQEQVFKEKTVIV